MGVTLTYCLRYAVVTQAIAQLWPSFTPFPQSLGNPWAGGCANIQLGMGITCEHITRLVELVSPPGPHLPNQILFPFLPCFSTGLSAETRPKRNGIHATQCELI